MALCLVIIIEHACKHWNTSTVNQNRPVSNYYNSYRYLALRLRGIKTKEIALISRDGQIIYFVLFPSASESGISIDKSKLHWPILLLIRHLSLCVHYYFTSKLWCNKFHVCKIIREPHSVDWKYINLTLISMPSLMLPLLGKSKTCCVCYQSQTFPTTMTYLMRA